MILMHLLALPLPLIFKKLSKYLARKNFSGNKIFNIISYCFFIVKLLLITVAVELFII